MIGNAPISSTPISARRVVTPAGGGGAVSLTANATTQSQTSATASLTQHHVLAATATTQSQTSAAATVTQHHVLAANATSQSQMSAAATLTQHNVLAAVATTQSQTSATAALTQHNVLTATATTQSQTSEAAVLTPFAPGAVSLTANDTTQSQTSEAAALSVPGGTPVEPPVTVSPPTPIASVGMAGGRRRARQAQLAQDDEQVLRAVFTEFLRLVA